MLSTGPAASVGDDSVVNIPAGDPRQHGRSSRDSVIAALSSGASIPMGQGGTCPPNIYEGGRPW